MFDASLLLGILIVAPSRAVARDHSLFEQLPLQRIEFILHVFGGEEKVIVPYLYGGEGYIELEVSHVHKGINPLGKTSNDVLGNREPSSPYLVGSEVNLRFLYDLQATVDVNVAAKEPRQYSPAEAEFVLSEVEVRVLHP